MLRRLCLFPITLAAASAHAQTPPDAAAIPETPYVSEPVLVVGSRLPAVNALVSNSVLVVRASDIEAKAPPDLPSLFRNLPGIHIDQVAGPGGFASLYLRGADPNHTIVLIDDVKVNDPTTSRGGGFDFGSLDPRTIDRIEILQGAASAIYGADAMAGVISITTKQPGPEQQQASASVGAGGRHYRTGNGNVMGNAASLPATAYVGYLEDSDGNDTSHSSLATGGFTMRSSYASASSIAVHVRGQSRDTRSFPDDSGGPTFAAQRELERRETDGFLGGLTLRQAHARGEVSGRFSFFEQDAAVTSPGVLPGVRDPFGIPASRSHTDFRRSSFDLLSRYDLDAGASTAIGAGYQHERGTSRGELFFGPTSLPTDFSQARTTGSVFGEWRSSDNLALPAQLGLRYDRSSTYGNQLTWRGTLAHPLPAPAGILVANLGTGFKPPSFFALSDPIVGSPQLRPERSRSVDLGIYSGKAASRHIYSMSVFRVRTEDLIDFDAGPPPALVNRSNVTTTGAQAFAGTKFQEGASLSATATVMTFDLPEGAPPLRNRPRARASAEASVPVGSRGSIGVSASWAGKTYDSSVPTGQQQLPSSFIVNSALRYPYGAAMFTVAIDNLLDRRFEQFVGFPEPGRRARIEVSIPLWR